MGLVGADVAQLRDLAGVMRRNADILERDIVGVIVASLRVSPWAGTDAEHFKQIWTFQSARQIWSAAMRLREAADVLDRNADDQDKASASDGTGGRGRIPAADRGRGKGKKTTANPEGFTEPRGGKYGLARDCLDLSMATYDHTVGPQHDGKLPAGWSEVSSSELKKMGLDPKLLGSVGDDFAATLYRDVDGRYVLAFEGTDPGDARDWSVDIAGATLLSTQQVHAINLTNKIKEALERNGLDSSALTLTGHSLGGGLASIASIGTGVPAVTFNAAGVSSGAIAYAAGANVLGGEKTGSLLNALGGVTAYTSSADPVSIGQDLAPGVPSAYGERVRLSAPSGGGERGVWDRVVYEHMDEPLRKGLDELATKEGEGY